MLEEAAEETFRQDMEIKVTISARDLTMLEKKALEDGLSSQARITRILHKFASALVSAKRRHENSREIIPGKSNVTNGANFDLRWLLRASNSPFFACEPEFLWANGL